MPIHLLWGNDAAGIDLAIEKIINEIIDPAWKSINLSRLEGIDSDQSKKALEESLTPPFGNGGRIVLLAKSTFCNGCSIELGEYLESVLEIIPSNSHLILRNENKPDGRLKTTKAIQKLIKANQAYEKSFLLPAIWDERGQKKLVERIAEELNLLLEEKAIDRLVNAIGNDSTRIRSELQKLEIYASLKKDNPKIKDKTLITAESVSINVIGITTNALEISNCLLANNISESISLFDALIDNGEPPLRIIATLTGQIRGWLWVAY